MTIYTVMVVGDSLSFASLSYFNQYFGGAPALDPGSSADGSRKQYRPYLTSPKRVGINFAVAGTFLVNNAGNMMAAAASTVDAAVPAVKRNPVIVSSGVGGTSGEARKYILMIMAGTNADSSSPTAHAANMSTYCLARVAAGVDAVIVGTLPSRTDNVIANFDTAYAQPYNAIIKGAGWKEANGVAAICDFAANANLGATGAADNTTYFADKVHPTTTGYTIMGGIFAPVLDSVIAGLGG